MKALLLTLTEAAVEKIKHLQEARDRDGMAVRVAVREDGPAAFAYTLQFVSEDDGTAEDETVDVAGVRLIVDRESVPRLEGATIDFVEKVSGSGFSFDNPNQPPLLKDPIAARVHRVIQEQVNPGVAQHGGHVTLLDVRDGKVYVQLGGGCQGCGMVDVTLKQRIETTIRQEVPEIAEVLDTTDHASGTNPYYQPDP